MPTLRPKAVVADVFADVEPEVRAVARRFARRFHVDHEDAYSSACLYSLEAIHHHDQDKGGLVPRLRRIIWWRMFDDHKRERTHLEQLGLVETPDHAGRPTHRGTPARHVHDRPDPDTTPARDGQPAVFELPPTLGDDARVVIRMLLDDAAVERAIRAAKPSTRSILECLRRCLVEQMTWTAARVAEAFGEVRRALA